MVILVVDDDRDVVEALELVLAQEGCEVIPSSGPGATGLAASRPVDLVLLDWNIPGVDVRELIPALRSVTGAPLVLCTGADEPERLRRMSGADAVLRKPFSVEDLLALLPQAPAPRP